MSRRLFEQPTTGTPSGSKRVAFGAAGLATENITFTDLITYFESVLGFLKQSENLADLDDVATALSNLGTYSSTEIDNLLDAKAFIYSLSQTDGALKGNNATTYTPSGDYNPATKKYVDDATPLTLLLAGEILRPAATTFNKFAGSLTGTATKNGTGFYRLTHNNGNTNYMVSAECIATGQDSNKIASIVKTNNYFDVATGPSTGYSDSGYSVEFRMWGY